MINLQPNARYRPFHLDSVTIYPSFIAPPRQDPRHCITPARASMSSPTAKSSHLNLRIIQLTQSKATQSSEKRNRSKDPRKRAELKDNGLEAGTLSNPKIISPHLLLQSESPPLVDADTGAAGVTSTHFWLPQSLGESMDVAIVDGHDERGEERKRAKEQVQSTRVREMNRLRQRRKRARDKDKNDAHKVRILTGLS